MAPVRMRALRRDDVADLCAQLAGPLETAYPGGGAWLRRHLADALSGHGEATVAVGPDGRPVALLLAQRKGVRIKLSCLWVAPAVRRAGIGASLLDRAVAAFGARALYVTLDQDRVADLGPLLSAAGFTATAALPGRYRPGAVEHVWARPPDQAPTVRALSLTRPWGDLILAAGKDVENRSRRTSHRGLLVLHGAKSTTGLAEDFTRGRGLPAAPDAGGCPTGYLGVAHLVAVDCHDEDCGSRCSAWAMPGSWHWRVAFPAAFPAPIPGRGNVSLWTPPGEVLAAVNDTLADTLTGAP